MLVMNVHLDAQQPTRPADHVAGDEQLHAIAAQPGLDPHGSRALFAAHFARFSGAGMVHRAVLGAGA